jgi:hypothetical protein
MTSTAEPPMPELMPVLEFMEYKLYIQTVLIPMCKYDPNQPQSLRSKTFENYKGTLNAILDLQSRWQKMEELAPIDGRFCDLRESVFDYFHDEFPRYVTKFHTDNAFWQQRELARVAPETYMPTTDVVTARRSSRFKETRRPIVHNGKLYTSGLYHFLHMWGSDFERPFTEEDMDPRVVDMLIAAEAVNESAVHVQLVPFQISPSGELLLGGLQTNVFTRAVDCLWLKNYVW